MPFDFEAHLLKWTKGQDYWAVGRDRVRDGSICHKIENLVSTHLNGNYMGPMWRSICLFNPAQSAEDPTKVAIWPDVAAREAGEVKRVRMKPGRALLKIYPDATSDMCEEFSTWFRETYVNANLSLAVKKSKAAGDFVYAYTGPQAEYTNPTTTCLRKSMSNSCMRYEASEFECDTEGHHPVEAYASGEFEIWWVENSERLLFSRCVVWIRPKDGIPVPGPIYGVNETSMNLIEDALRTANAEFDEGLENCWIGAKLAKIEVEYGYVVPYVDCYPRRATEEGEFLVIERRGDVCLETTNGVSEGSRTCTTCFESIRPDYVYTNGEGEHFCESCYNEVYGHCEVCGSECEHDGLHTVHSTRNFVDPQWCERCADRHAVLTENDGYWRRGETHTTHDEIVISEQEYREGYFTCDISDKIYEIEFRVAVINVGYAAQPVIDENPDRYVYHYDLRAYAVVEPADTTTTPTPTENLQEA